ncbi:PREDICTED: translation initiation factor IF-2-like, partial [Chinchilla lanigera]|uniref:translation initiation factor IF-2-like n=1 Tax=Chinchilla lanigera TaxID=34839 RepID=UPI0006968205
MSFRKLSKAAKVERRERTGAAGREKTLDRRQPPRTSRTASTRAPSAAAAEQGAGVRGAAQPAPGPGCAPGNCPRTESGCRRSTRGASPATLHAGPSRRAEGPGAGSRGPIGPRPAPQPAASPRFPPRRRRPCARKPAGAAGRALRPGREAGCPPAR